MVEISDVVCEHTKYFSKAVEFLQQISWMFDFPNTEILVRDVPSSIPPEWVSIFSSMTDEQNAHYPEQLFTQTSWPDDLRSFTERCADSRLNINKYAGTSPPVVQSKALQRGIGPKKMHEISIMSSLINEKCRAMDIESLVDMGSGLGHLGEMLARDYDFKVLGLECDQSKINTALARLTKQNVQTRVQQRDETTTQCCAEPRVRPTTSVEYRERLKYICTFISSRIILNDSLVSPDIDKRTSVENRKADNMEPLERERIDGYGKNGDIEEDTIVKARGLLDEHNTKIDKDTIVKSSRLMDENNTKIDKVTIGKSSRLLDENSTNIDKDAIVKSSRLLDENNTKIDKDAIVKSSRLLDENNTKIDKDTIVKSSRLLEENNTKIDKDTIVKSSRLLDHLDMNNALDVETTEPMFESGRVRCEDLATLLPGEPYCFIGLHTCGDLSVAIMQHFFSLPLARQLICIPCCYHKLEPRVKRLATTFANFPLSQALRRAYGGRGSFLSVPFLRLAGQETAMVWATSTRREKQEKVFRLLFRGVLQLYAAKESVLLIKKSRRPLRITQESAAQDISKLIRASVDSFDLQCTTTLRKVDWNTSLLSQLWRDNVAKTPLICTILTLQNCLQASAESLVLLDRLRFLHESGLTRVELLPIFDERISPRRFCFVVSK